jgi:hypothetical protein
MAALVAFAGILLAYYLMKEPYETTPAMETKSVTVTRDIMNTLVAKAQPAVAKKLGKCVYPLETNYVRQEGDTYKCRFTFMVVDAYPYGVGVSVDIKGDEVVSVTLENQQTIDRLESFDQFETGAAIKKASMPTAAQFKAVFS